MTDEIKEKVDGLNYALNVVRGRRILRRTPDYLAAVDEMEIFLLAAIERVENGEPMSAVATVTNEKRSIEPWVLEAARELAMDSAHIPCIAQIIQRHVPPRQSSATTGQQ